MAKACKTCKGRGRWQERVVIGHEPKIVADEIIWYECNDCHGSGIEQDPEESPPFDVAGDSYTDGDDQ